VRAIRISPLIAGVRAVGGKPGERLEIERGAVRPDDRLVVE